MENYQDYTDPKESHLTTSGVFESHGTIGARQR